MKRVDVMRFYWLFKGRTIYRSRRHGCGPSRWRTTSGLPPCRAQSDWIKGTTQFVEDIGCYDSTTALHSRAARACAGDGVRRRPTFV